MKHLHRYLLSFSIFSFVLLGIYSLPNQALAMSAQQVMPCRSDNADCWPAAFDMVPANNKIWYAERFTGQIRIFDPVTQKNKLWTTIENVATDGEQGVLGIALHPKWPDLKWVYVYYTNADPLENRIIRMRKKKIKV